MILTSQIIGDMQYFVGKICTVLTKNIPRGPLNKDEHANFFTGKVIRIDNCCIWVEHLITRAKAVYFHDSVVGIAEEQVQHVNKEDAEEIKKEYLEKRKESYPTTKVPSTPMYVDVNKLSRQAAALKEKYGDVTNS